MSDTPAVASEHLPVLAALFTQTPRIDAALISQGLAIIDPDGQWQAAQTQPSGLILSGRGTQIVLTLHPAAPERDRLEAAINASHWLADGDPASLTLLRAASWHVTIACAARGATGADYAATRQIAKAMAWALATLTQKDARPGLAGIVNLTAPAAFSAAMSEDLLAPLQGDEVPLQLFVTLAFHQPRPGALSLTTRGMRPFAGHEAGVWEAPGDLPAVADTLSEVLRYLLLHGPVLADGDTIGQPGGHALRCRMGVDRADAQLPMLWLDPGDTPPPVGPQGARQPPRARTSRARPGPRMTKRL